MLTLYLIRTLFIFDTDKVSKMDMIPSERRRGPSYRHPTLINLIHLTHAYIRLCTLIYAYVRSVSNKNMVGINFKVGSLHLGAMVLY